MVFLATEDIAGDPNWTIETLYRILRREELLREAGLPETLFLQVDNCFRENKNSYVIGYLSWLVERGVFQEIFLSFLPTGHTHYDPDQCASRIANAVKFRDVKTLEQYQALIKQCFHPTPEVEVVQAVMDVKQLFNPGLKDGLPVGTSRVRQTRGIGTKSIQPGADWYMGETSPLHWRIRKDTNGKVCVQSKFTCDDIMWSNITYPWTEQAPRPDNRAWEPSTSGMVPADITMAPTRPCAAARVIELKAALDGSKHRLTAAQWEQVQLLQQRVVVPREPPVVPDDHGTFAVDQVGSDEEDGEDEEEDQLYARPTTVFQSQSHQNRARALRRKQGHASNPLVVGRFVAYTPNYTTETKDDDKQLCWVGKIINIDADSRQVRLQRYHTSTIKNLDCERNCGYRVWMGPDPKEWIDVTRVLETFDLTEKRRSVPNNFRRKIQTALLLIATIRGCAGSVSVGVGTDLLENPAE
jgi:hypothetical protein